MRVLLPVLALLMVGCIHKPSAVHNLGGPLGGPPPVAPSPILVSSCETERTWHNVWVMAGSIFGGAGGATGTAAAISQDHTVQVGVAIGAAVSGLLAAISTDAAGIESDAYSTGNCQQILQQAANASVTTTP